jgi:RHS repeat-associated protein
MTDRDGKVAASYEYDAFGRITSKPVPLANPFTYTAREYDTATGLYYYRARYYDPKLGRFLGTDPVVGTLEDPLTINPFVYVSNNPLRFVDPLGTAGFQRIDLSAFQSGSSVSLSESNFPVWAQATKEATAKRIVGNIRYWRTLPPEEALKQINSARHLRAIWIQNIREGSWILEKMAGSVEHLKAEQMILHREAARQAELLKKRQGNAPAAKQPSTSVKQPSNPPSKPVYDPKAETKVASRIKIQVQEHLRSEVAKRGGDWKRGGIAGPRGRGGSSFVSRSRGGFSIMPASQVSLASLARAGLNVARVLAGGRSIYVTVTSETPVLTGMVEAGTWAGAIKGGAIGASLAGIPGGLIGAYLGATSTSAIAQAFVEAILAEPGASPYMSPAGPAGITASQSAKGATAGTAQALLKPSGTTQPVNVGPPPSTPKGTGTGPPEKFNVPTTSQGASQTTSGTTSDSPKESGQVEIKSTEWILERLKAEAKAKAEAEAKAKAEEEEKEKEDFPIDESYKSFGATKEEKEDEDDPTDDEWAEGMGQRERKRSITIASGSGGGDGTKTGYSSKTLHRQQEEQLASFGKPADGESQSRSQGSTSSIVTSSAPSSSTTEPASGPATGEPGSPDPSSQKEPGETEESASPPPSLTNTDWVVAYGDIFFFIMEESSSGELTGCIRQRGGAMGICDEKIGTRSGKQVTFKKASYLGGATWNLQLSSDGKEMNGTQTTKEYGTRKVRVLIE